jgi:hypothetical protein
MASPVYCFMKDAIYHCEDTGDHEATQLIRKVLRENWEYLTYGRWNALSYQEMELVLQP